MENQVVETEMISVNKMYVDSLTKKIQFQEEQLRLKDDHIRGLENMNEELVKAVNRMD